ncbi:RidA family protein [Streptomyces antnestii]|uniref:RidA family protein n=1 Tax=Streptomyces antnestii TaxID=2494256 RepID=A0A3S2V5V1_9ACTN|nr:RidA family protein [Streptomyces sp. San01]RVU15116.1 RidA family protein [Streptomyces sp. San01]
MSVASRIAELGLDLPEVPAAIANYAPATRVGSYVYTSGQLPLADGKLVATGAVGDETSVDSAREAARQCALNAVAAIASVAGGIEHITQIVKVVGFVSSAPEFHEQSTVIDAASDLLVELFGAEVGRHSRSAVGVAALPRDASVEIEIIACING